MNDKELYFKMNDFVTNMHPWDEIIYDNINFFYSLNFHIIESLDSIFNDFNDEINISKMPIKSFYENIEIINIFYKKIGLNFEVNDVIKNGVLEYKFYNYNDEDKINRLKYGYNCYDGCSKNKEICACNNGLITDSIILVHELSHYRNQVDNGRGIVGRFFTETLALTDELIYYDYLLNNGYKIDKSFIQSNIYFFYQNALETLSVMELILLFSEIGGITLEDFKFYYKTSDDYNIDIDIFKDMNFDYSLLADTGYNVSFLVAPYLFYKYKKIGDYSFLEHFNNTIMNPKNDIIDCFNELGLNGLDENDIKVLRKDIKKFTKQYVK